MNSLKMAILSSIIVASSAAHCEILQNAETDTVGVLQQKVLCDMNSVRFDSCDSVDAAFENLKKNVDVEKIHQLYSKEKIQMEMMFGGHTPGTNTGVN